MDALRFFHRHIVPLFIEFDIDGKISPILYSSFVLSINDRWLLTTAGHCLRDIERILNHGGSIRRCRLIDSNGLNAIHKSSIPFHLNINNQFHIYDEEKGYNFGIIDLPKNTVSLLRSNEIEPLSEESWLSYPDDPDHLIMVGFPKETTIFHENFFESSSSYHYVTKIDNPNYSNTFDEDCVFFGKINLDQNLNSIKGTSGGPIFAFENTPDGRMKYWLYGLQSSWYRHDRIIIGCFIRPFAITIMHAIENLDLN